MRSVCLTFAFILVGAPSLASTLAGTEAKLCEYDSSCVEKPIFVGPLQDVTFQIDQLFLRPAEEIEYAELAIFKLGPSGWEQYFQPSKIGSMTNITFNAAVGSAIALTKLNVVPFWGPKALTPLDARMFNICAATMSLDDATQLGEQAFKPSPFSVGQSGTLGPVSNLAASSPQFFSHGWSSTGTTPLTRTSSETQKEAVRGSENPTPVPLPASLWMMLAGLAGLGLARNNSKTQK